MLLSNVGEASVLTVRYREQSSVQISPVPLNHAHLHLQLAVLQQDFPIPLPQFYVLI